MSNVPKSTPHSDLDGVHEDERPNVETAHEAGQGTGDLERARRDSKGRPPYSEEDKPESEKRAD